MESKNENYTLQNGKIIRTDKTSFKRKQHTETFDALEAKELRILLLSNLQVNYLLHASKVIT